MGNPQSVPSSSQPFKDQAASQARSMGTSNQESPKPTAVPQPSNSRTRSRTAPFIEGLRIEVELFPLAVERPAGGGKLRRQRAACPVVERLILHEKDREVFILLGQALNPRQLLQHDPCPVCLVQGKGVDRAFHMGGPYRIFLAVAIKI